MACESCHHIENGWTSGQALDAKVGGGMNTRNAPSVLNLGSHPAFYWDGRMPTLEAVSAAAWKGQLGADPAVVAKALNESAVTKALFDRAFGGTSGATAENVPMALASFFRALQNGNSPWDKFTAGDKTAMSKEAQAGWALFQKSGCVACHVPPLFSDVDYHALGVNDDPGRKNATKLDADQGKFKTPSLRNVALTGPYFHDGSAKALSDAVAFMAKGGNVKPGSDPKLKAVKLSKKDAANLEEFLKALTGESTFTKAPAQP
jgi:cytochrome c peroxidase